MKVRWFFFYRKSFRPFPVMSFSAWVQRGFQLSARFGLFSQKCYRSFGELSRNGKLQEWVGRDAATEGWEGEAARVWLVERTRDAGGREAGVWEKRWQRCGSERKRKTKRRAGGRQGGVERMGKLGGIMKGVGGRWGTSGKHGVSW